MSRFFCLWIPHFEAWSAVRSAPSLKGRALIVQSAGRVLAASPLAVNREIQVGWSTARAQSLVPELLVCNANPAHERLAWDTVLERLLSLTGHIESPHPGLAFAALKPRPIGPLLAELDAYGGLADDRTTAELAAYALDHEGKQRGLCRTVPLGRSTGFVGRLDVEILENVGVSADTITRLHWFGYRKIGQMKKLSKARLLEQFNEGRLLHHYLSCDDERPVATFMPPAVIEAKFVFEHAAEEASQWLPVLGLLQAEACGQLGPCAARTVKLHLETSTGLVHMSRILRTPGRDIVTIREAVGQLAKELAPLRGIRVESVTLSLGGMEQANALQANLFDQRAIERKNGLITVLKLLESRFPGSMGRFRIKDPFTCLHDEGHIFEPALATVAQLEEVAPMKRSRRKRA